MTKTDIPIPIIFKYSILKVNTLYIIQFNTNHQIPYEQFLFKNS